MSTSTLLGPAYVATDDEGNVVAGMQFTVWTAREGGTQITSLQDLDGNALPGYVTSDSKGRVRFVDPAGRLVVWLQPPGTPLPDRWLIVSVEAQKNVAQAITDAAQARADASVAKAEADASVTTATGADGRSVEALDKATLALQASSVAFAQNATLLGVLPTDDDGDPQNNTDALNGGLMQGDVFLPAGTFIVAGEIKVPSARRFYGAGIDKTVLKMADGADLQLNVVTNIGNTRTEHTDPDTAIRVGDMTIDGNGLNRTGTPPHVATSGCCVGFATVEDVVVERVRAINGSQHGFDVGASIYAYGGEHGNGTTVTVYPPGPSNNVVFRDCIAEDPLGDDAFTCHCSTNVRYEGCSAIWTGNAGEPLGESQQGFEIDDGMIGSVVRDCYVRGFVRGIQVKGHETNPPARRVLLDNCTVEGCSISYSISFVDQSTLTPQPSYRVATDVELRGCKSLAPVQTHTAVVHWMAVELNGYDNVRISDMVCLGGAHNDIQVNAGASNILIERVTFDGTWVVPYIAGTGAVQATGTAGGGLVVRDVKTRTPVGGILVRITPTTGRYVVSGVTGAGTDSGAPAVYLSALTPDMMVERVAVTGFLTGVQVGTGTYAGLHTTSTRTATWTAIDTVSGYQAVSATDQFRWSYDAGVVVLDCNVMPTSGQFPAGLTQVSVTGALPAGIRPDGNRNFAGVDQSGRSVRVAVNSAGTIQLVVDTAATHNYVLGQFAYRP